MQCKNALQIERVNETLDTKILPKLCIFIESFELVFFFKFQNVGKLPVGVDSKFEIAPISFPE
jgi:hypothetical protein